jgi:DNA-binding NarL/FixJ family response regulator
MAGREIQPTQVTAEAIALAIIEDHVMVSQGLQLALGSQPDFEVVGTAATLQDGVDLVERTQPAVVLLDGQLPDGRAIDGIERLLRVAPQCAVVVLSPTADYHTVVRALEAGAAGYLLKDQRLEELFDAVRLARSGGRPLAPQLVSTLVNVLGGSGEPRRQLSRREIEVLRYLAEGLSTADVCNRMQLSVNTVRNHVQSAIRRLGAHSKLEAVAIAQREGIISLAS